MSIEAPYFPIIYVRGYAGSESEIEDTVSDPYMGFNIGSSKIRQQWDSTCKRYYFESPLVRLMKDFDYRDVYHAGENMPLGFDIHPRSIFIYRYYEDPVSESCSGIRLPMEEAAKGLGNLILQIRERFSLVNPEQPFRVYLVAHSMGGLVCRCLLQNHTLHNSKTGQSYAEARASVDKVFTYATPHNGIDIHILGNVPGFFTRNDADNFNRTRISEYLDLREDAGGGAVSSLDGKFDPDRFFCLVGTNAKDYDVANGVVRKFVGPMSDGLVRIENATTSGTKIENGIPVPVSSPRAFVHRSHSGHYGIVNSEEGFQNLTRFLFGDVRVDGVLRVQELTLPAKVQKAKDEGKQIRASYHFEAIARVRGKMWDLHRRTASENSAVFRMYDELFPKDGSEPRYPHLFSVFLSRAARVNTQRVSLGFSLDLRILVPPYEIDKAFWGEDHYEGGYLFSEKINFEAIPPKADQAEWRLKYGFDSSTPNRATREAEVLRKDDSVEFSIPIEQKTRPGIDATLVLNATPWNVPLPLGGIQLIAPSPFASS